MATRAVGAKQLAATIVQPGGRLLEGLDVGDEVHHPLTDSGVGLEGPEHLPPDWHFGRAVSCGGSSGTGDEVADALAWERAATLSSQCRKVRRPGTQSRRDGTVTFAARAVTRRAVLLKRIASRKRLDQNRRRLLRVHRGGDRTMGNECEDSRRDSECEACFSHNHHLYIKRTDPVCIANGRHWYMRLTCAGNIGLLRVAGDVAKSSTSYLS